MKFKTDENLPHEVADLLKDHGHDALTVVEQQLAGAVDSTVARVCQSEQRIFVTLDLDFADIRTYPPEDYAGMIVLRPQSQSISSVVRLTLQLMPLLEVASPAGQLWILDESHVRIRGSRKP